MSFPIDVNPAIIVFIMIALDIITGIIKGASTHTLSSSVMRSGIWHKSAIIALVTLAAFISYSCNMWDSIPDEFGVIYPSVCAYLVVMEITSCVENILVANPELNANKIRDLFKINKED